MASDLNVVALTGRLTRDSELRYTNGGMAIAKFSIAVNRRTKKVDQWVDEASFFDCSLFGKSAEGVNQFLNKGQQVAINGSLVQSRWEQDGQNRSRVEVMVNSLTLLGSKPDEQPRQAAPQALESEPSMSNFSDDRIPF